MRTRTITRACRVDIPFSDMISVSTFGMVSHNCVRIVVVLDDVDDDLGVYVSLVCGPKTGATGQHRRPPAAAAAASSSHTRLTFAAQHQARRMCVRSNRDARHDRSAT